MTGGTLSVDKKVHSEKPLQIHTYALHLFDVPEDIHYTDFHQGMHTNEHLLAYTPDTGSLRASLAEIIPWLDTKMVLDVSPFEFEDRSYGFRITSLVELDAQTLKKATKISVDKAIGYLEQVKAGDGDTKWFKGIPFATAEQCGQFTYHHPEKAQETLRMVNTGIMRITGNTQNTEHQKAVVCDLRLLKPKTDENDDCITLDPKFSYYLSKKIEHELPQRIPGTAVVVGTFGCMTGTYLCVSHIGDEEKDIPEIHATIMDVLRSIERENLPENHRKQLEMILENYNKFKI